MMSAFTIIYRYLRGSTKHNKPMRYLLCLENLRTSSLKTVCMYIYI